jgi:hypothetical protein
VKRHSRIASIATLAVLGALFCLPAFAQASFGVKSLSAVASNEDGSVDLQAGSHPYGYTVDFTMNQDAEGTPEGTLRDLIVDLPPGLVGDPRAVPRCSMAAFEGQFTACPGNTQIGVALIKLRGLPPANEAIFNLTPPLGVAAEVGFGIIGSNSFQEASLRPDDYGVSVSDITIPQFPVASGIQSVSETIWGVPADPGHDSLRQCRGPEGEIIHGCSAGLAPAPFLTLPTSCDQPLKTTVAVDSVQEPGDFLTRSGYVSKSTLSLDEGGNPAPQNGCEAVPFSPKIAAAPSSRLAEGASGLDFELKLPSVGHEGPGGIAETQPKKAVVTLPEGVTVNPSAAEGTGVCSPQQYAAETIDSKPGEGCPESSKLGSLVAHTPVLDELIEGSLYLAKPYDNPSNSLIGLYIVARARDRGILIKQAGKVEPDPKTGQLVTTFDNLPPLPYSDFKMHFREGARGPLVTPPTCGSYETKAELTPFSTPDQPFTATAGFQIEHGVDGGACPSGGAPFHPSFEAGTLNNNAGSYSPFYMRLTRRDGDQDLTKFSAKLPPGMVAKLAGTTECPDAAIAAAKAKTGLQEQASPSCPSSSQIGRALGGAGVGSQLLYVPGKIYLAGPYLGAPLSVVAMVPAVAGPFDVGNVVVRQALRINPRTAEVTADGASSDPLPHILAGIPLKVRDIRVYVDKPSFTLNPTSCDPFATAATIWGGGSDVFSAADDSPLGASARFQAADCASLGFKPRLALNLKGGTKRGGHPALTGTYTPRPGDANLRHLVLRLPHSAFLDQAHIKTICTRVQFAAGAGNGTACPQGAIYGQATAYTPILEQPLSGPVILRSSNHNLPDFVAALHGKLDVEAVARIDSKNGGIRATFDETPDAPLTKVVVKMQGAKKGLIVNSTDLCASAHHADAQFEGQNGKRYEAKPAVGASCGKGKKHRKSGHRHKTP